MDNIRKNIQRIYFLLQNAVFSTIFLNVLQSDLDDINHPNILMNISFYCQSITRDVITIKCMRFVTTNL